MSDKFVVLANHDRFGVPYTRGFRIGVTLDVCRDVAESVVAFSASDHFSRRPSTSRPV